MQISHTEEILLLMLVQLLIVQCQKGLDDHFSCRPLIRVLQCAVPDKSLDLFRALIRTAADTPHSQ